MRVCKRQTNLECRSDFQSHCTNATDACKITRETKGRLSLPDLSIKKLPASIITFSSQRQQMTNIVNEIIERLRIHQCHPDTYPKVRRGAVLICLNPMPSGEFGVLLTLRASTLRTHPNEVCLPGGNANQIVVFKSA
jgi:hypothetical protein